MRHILLMLAIVLNLLIQDATRSTVAAQAEVIHANCAPRDFVIQWLQDNKGQEPVASRLADGILLEILANRATGTWTIIGTTPHGMSCLIRQGDGWIPTDPSERSSE